jgi:hypothetical protein
MVEAVSSKATLSTAHSSRWTDNPVRLVRRFAASDDAQDCPRYLQSPAACESAAIFFTLISLVRRIATLVTSPSRGPRHFVAACPLFLPRLKWICLSPIIDDSLSNDRQAPSRTAARKPVTPRRPAVVGSPPDVIPWKPADVILREPQRPKDLAYLALNSNSLGMTGLKS